MEANEGRALDVSSGNPALPAACAQPIRKRVHIHHSQLICDVTLTSKTSPWSLYYSHLSHNPYPLGKGLEVWVIEVYGLSGSGKPVTRD